MQTRTQVHMGTFVSITLPEKKSGWIEKGFREIKAVEKALSSYDEEADIYRLNHDGKRELSPYTYEALLLCRRYHAQSDGYFNIAVGSITKGLYRVGENERVAEETELDEAVVDFYGLRFERAHATLEKGVTVDLGGMGKGFGVDKVAHLYRSNGMHKGVIAASGDIRCLDRCNVSVQDPFREEGKVTTLRTLRPDMAVSTSGNYRRYVEEKIHNHLIDPKRKRPQRNFASITLVSHLSNSDLDAYATAASVMPRQKAVEFLDGLALAYILVTTDGKEIRSANLSEYAQEICLKLE